MLKNKQLKITVDTNLCISFITSNKQNLSESFLLTKKVSFLFNKELIKEIELTISKPKLKKYFGGNALENVLPTFEPLIDLVDIKNKVSPCRDPKNNFYLL